LYRWFWWYILNGSDETSKSGHREMKRLTGAQIVIESLIAEGVDVIFGYPGGGLFAPLRHY
jgi:hypothetical protein